VELPALSVGTVVDTSGAGDWCTAGFLHRLFASREMNELQGLNYNEIYHALRFGQSVAALSVAHIGARGLMRTRASKDALEIAQGILDSGITPSWSEPLAPLRSFDSICCTSVTRP
jgi:fructokinase